MATTTKKTVDTVKLISKFPELNNVVLDGQTDYKVVSAILVGAPNTFVWEVVNSLKAKAAFDVDEFYS